MGPVAAVNRPVLLLAGATGATGAAVVRRLAGHSTFRHTVILAREPVRELMRSMTLHVVAEIPDVRWPKVPADVAIVMFDPPRLYHRREQSLWTPQPAQVPELCQWLRECGVTTLAIVQPHDTGRLPAALQQGFLNLDEQSITTLGFARVLIIRSARDREADAALGFFPKTANMVLRALAHMIPAGDRPVRPATVADVVATALRFAPIGVHILSSKVLHEAAQGDVEKSVRAHLPQAPSA